MFRFLCKNPTLFFVFYFIFQNITDGIDRLVSHPTPIIEPTPPYPTENPEEPEFSAGPEAPDGNENGDELDNPDGGEHFDGDENPDEEGFGEFARVSIEPYAEYIQLNLASFLESVISEGFHTYSGSLTTPGNIFSTNCHQGEFCIFSISE